MIFRILASVLTAIGIAVLFNLNAETVSQDIMQLLGKKGSLREQTQKLRHNNKENKIYKFLVKTKGALTATGKAKQFTFICSSSLILFGIGILLSFLINNVFLTPALSVSLAGLPFIYTARMLNNYDKQTKEELETALSIITSSYIRNDDILKSVEENLPYIKPPLREFFEAFIGEASAISANIKGSLYSLREKVDNEIYREWCDTLILCQDDRTLKDTLLPIVSKLTDVRLVNNELKTMLTNARNEYFGMLALVIGSIPFLYVINKDWFIILVTTVAGKATLGICAVVILITTMFMLKYTKPIEYKR